MNVLKEFGLGVLYAVLSPLILAVIAIVAIFGIFNFLVQFIIMLVHFFQGKSLFPTFPEDKKAYDILQRALDKKRGVDAQQNVNAAPAAQNIYVQQNYYPSGTPVPPLGQQPYQPQYQQPLPQAPNSFQPYQQPQQALPQQPQTPPYTQIPVINAAPEPQNNAETGVKLQDFPTTDITENNGGTK